MPSPLKVMLFPYTTLFRSGRISFADAPAECEMAERLTPQHFCGLRGIFPICSYRGCGYGAFSYRPLVLERDRKSTRLNSSHVAISYAVFCLKKKTFATYTN